jgi:uncharacterized protein YlxW (UPF0749 family)
MSMSDNEKNAPEETAARSRTPEPDGGPAAGAQASTEATAGAGAPAAASPEPPATGPASTTNAAEASGPGDGRHGGAGREGEGREGEGREGEGRDGEGRTGERRGGQGRAGYVPAGGASADLGSVGQDPVDEGRADGADDADRTVVVDRSDDATVVLTEGERPAERERFAGLLPAPGVAGRRRYESSSRPEVESTGASDEDEAVDSGQDAPAGRSLFGRRWAGGNRAAALIGVLLGLLGFALAVQVRSNTATNGLSGARQEDLVRILDDLTSREERLRTQISSLEAARARLTTTGDKNTAALNEAKTRSQALGVLAGTLPAQGPGITLSMSDPHAKLRAEDILDAVEELRAAGAEAIQVGQVRIGLNSSFIDDGSTIKADGQPLAAPYQILAIGDAATLATALNIPGGVVDTVRQAGGQATITQQDKVVIRVLRSLSTPHYAQPAE